ncbi:MAG: CBS domain-containing protein [Nitrospinae bacterium]|nr:CBS domain-containing protein [Nitrospinota bacterium]
MSYTRNKNYSVIDKDVTISDAGSLMREYNISHLAVTKDDEIAGIVSIRDLAYKSKEPAQTY